MDWLKSLAEFVRTWLAAFALFGGGSTAIAARLNGHLKNETDFIIGFLAAFGFWMLVAMAADKLFLEIKKRRRANRISQRRMLNHETATQSAEAKAKVDQERAIGNIDHLHDWEAEALAWIYHQQGQRARASINHVGISGLVTLGLLQPEDKRQTSTDRIWFIPEPITQAIRERFGAPDQSKGKLPPPWQGKKNW